MPDLYQALLFIHVSTGAASLLLFWIPVAARKGSRWHKRAGRWYVNAMYAVTATAFVVALLVIIDPIGTKHAEAVLSMADSMRISNRERITSLFLIAIATLVVTSVRHGLLTLRARHNHTILRTPTHISLNALLGLMGFVLIYLGFVVNQILFFVFAGICIAASLGNLRYCLKRDVQHSEWMIAHMGAMIGAGIGSYTAFFVFGGNRYFAELLTGNWLLIPWVAPALIGTGFTVYLTRKYRKRHGLRNNLV